MYFSAFTHAPLSDAVFLGHLHQVDVARDPVYVKSYCGVYMDALHFVLVPRAEK